MSVKEAKKKQAHVILGVGCFSGGILKHADFKNENGRLICNHCGVDFTDELIALEASIEHIKRHKKLPEGSTNGESCDKQPKC